MQQATGAAIAAAAEREKMRQAVNEHAAAAVEAAVAPLLARLAEVERRLAEVEARSR